MPTCKILSCCCLTIFYKPDIILAIMRILERFFGRQLGRNVSVEQTKPPSDLLSIAELKQTAEILLRDLQFRLFNTPELKDTVVKRWLRMVPGEKVLEEDKKVSFNRGSFQYFVLNHLHNPSFTSITVYRVPENETLSMFDKEMISVSSGLNSFGSIAYQRINNSTSELYQNTKTAEARIRQFMEDFPQPREEARHLVV